MAARSDRTIAVVFSGDVVAQPPVAATPNLASPAQIQVVTLAAGDNTITVPSGGTTPVACTIVKPSANTSIIKLKGVGGDAGVKLHVTDPDSVSLDPSQATFVLNAAAQIVGVRLVWS